MAGASESRADPESADPQKASSEWQKDQQSTSRHSEESTAEAERASLLEKASRFLDDDGIKDASEERKRAFLRTKGLSEQEIQHLLVSKSERAASDGKSMAGREHEAVSPLPHDAPPIITYPEFLFQSQKPPPLVTTSRLLSAAYIASGTAATMYGLDQYLVQPMVESLSAARHSLFETAASNVGELNNKLEQVVSKIPEKPGVAAKEDDDSDESPTRFFSRTIATQTSPRISRSQSMSSSLSEEGEGAPKSVLVEHSTQLSKLQEMLSDLDQTTMDDEKADAVGDSVDRLTEYLRALDACGKTGQTDPQVPSFAEADGVAKVRAEIKNVKGVLLSARNFPSMNNAR